MSIKFYIHICIINVFFILNKVGLLFLILIKSTPFTQWDWYLKKDNLLKGTDIFLLARIARNNWIILAKSYESMGWY